MAPEARSKRSSFQAKSTPSTDWLPYQDEPKYIAKSLRTRDLEPLAQHDWFVSLALAMKHHGDGVQSQMVGKLYYFLLDFIPQALNEEYGHISGKNVIDYLLCHAGEYQFSRHRICKNADTAFKNLEKWIRLGKDWQDASKDVRCAQPTRCNRHEGIF
ncbi:hypothetical protein G7054_g14932 [Neopestalotiopsis clavispora]|nr:hypothetical protein G7054_g14932 [Neopestalotiopsis clavispora]